jgi:thiol:disulfide interchange protein DsbD
MILGATFLGIALFLAPALFGRPPKSQVWDRLVIGILPPDAGSDFQAEGPTMLASSDGKPREEKATDADPARAERQEKTYHGVSWGLSYDQAVERSKAEKKPILIDFTGVNCANCRLMEKRVLPRPEVVSVLDRFITVQLYTDFVPIASITADQREELAKKNQDRQVELTNEVTNPFYVVLSPDGKLLGGLGGYNPPEAFVDFLSKSLDKLKGNDSGKVAQAP